MTAHADRSKLTEVVEASKAAPGRPAGYTIGVRELCEFAAKPGDLDLRFLPSPSAQKGIAGHRVVAGLRSAADTGHRAEVPLVGTYGALTVRGRADGYDQRRGCVEEVKTHKGDLVRLPVNHRALHLAGGAPVSARQRSSSRRSRPGKVARSMPSPGRGTAPGGTSRAASAPSGPAGSDEAPPELLYAAILFATAGELVPRALRTVREGGRVVCAGIHMSDIPGIAYADLWKERQLLSVANQTCQDGLDFLSLAPRIGIVTTTTRYPLQHANEALVDLRAGRFEGAAVLVP